MSQRKFEQDQAGAYLQMERMEIDLLPARREQEVKRRTLAVGRNACEANTQRQAGAVEIDESRVREARRPGVTSE